MLQPITYLVVEGRRGVAILRRLAQGKSHTCRYFSRCSSKKVWFGEVVGLYVKKKDANKPKQIRTEPNRTEPNRTEPNRTTPTSEGQLQTKLSFVHTNISCRNNVACGKWLNLFDTAVVDTSAPIPYVGRIP